MEKGILLYEDSKFINERRQEICKRVFAINEVLDSLLEQLGCVLSDEEVRAFMSKPDELFEIVCHNLLCPNGVAVKLVVRKTVSERLEPIMEEFKKRTRSLDDSNSYIILENGRAKLDVDAFEKAMDSHRTMLDSEPRQKAWKMAQKIVADIEKLEEYLSENTLGRVQSHAIGVNSIFCNNCLIHFNGKNGVKLEASAIKCVK